MRKLNLITVKRKMSKEQIMNAWRTYYKGRMGIPMQSEVSDSEIFEQMAIEAHKGTLNKWMNEALKTRKR